MPASTLLELLPDEVRHTRQEIPTDQNAYSLWLEAIKHFHPAADDDQVYSDLFYGTPITNQADNSEAETNEPDAVEYEPAEIPTGVEYDRLCDLVESNRKTFDLIDEGVARGRFQPPLNQNSDFDLLTDLRAICSMRCVGAKLLGASQPPKKATDELLKVLRIGNLLSNSEVMVVEYMIGLAIMRAALSRIEEIVIQQDLPSDLRAQLLVEIQRTQPSNDSLIQAYLMDLCYHSITSLDKMPASTNLESLVDHLCEYWYSSTTMGDILAEMDEEFADEQISAAVREERLSLRKQQLILLLKDHPRLFDKAQTVRLVGEDVAEYIRCIKQNDSVPEATNPLTGLWPELLSPSYPLDSFGMDPQAIAEREEIKNCLAPAELARLEKQFEQPTKVELAALNLKLRRIDNPVGQLLRAQLRPTNLSDVLAIYSQQQQATSESLQGFEQ